MQLCKLYLTNVERAYDCKNSYQFILLLGTIWDSIWPVHITGLQTIWSLLSLNHIIFFLKSISNMHAFCLRHSRTCSLHWFTGSCSPYHEIWNLINPVFFIENVKLAAFYPCYRFHWLYHSHELLHSFQIVKHSNFLGESNHLKFDQNYRKYYKYL